MKQPIAIVTGANSGIGRATTEALTRKGFHVIMVCRDAARGEAARQAISSDNDLVLCDLSSLRDVARAASEIRERHPRIDALVNNAGAVFDKREFSVDGWEMSWATNYLGPFALTHALLETLEKSDDARIANVISSIYKIGEIRFSDLNRANNFRLFRAYAQAKLALVLFTYELSRRLSTTTVSAHCVDPGLVRTNIGTHTTGYQRWGWSVINRFGRPPEHGAETTVHVLTDKGLAGVSGAHFKNLRRIKAAPVGVDPELAARVWEMSVDIIEGRVQAPQERSL